MGIEQSACLLRIYEGLPVSGSVALAAYLLMYVLYTVIVQYSRGMRHWENTCPGVARVPGL